MMKKAMLIALAALVCLAAVSGYAADRGVYMKKDIAWAQKGFPGIVERFEGDMEAVGEYVTSEIANQQGAGISYQVRGVVGSATQSKVLDLEKLWRDVCNEILGLWATDRTELVERLYTYYSAYGESIPFELQGWVNDYGHDPYDTIEDFLDYIDSKITS